MWPAPYEMTVWFWLRVLLALLCSGSVIKLLDDHADAEYDRQTGVVTVTNLLGNATLPYSLILFTIAVGNDYRLAVSLFLAAYAVGMLWDSRRPLPTGLAGWQEGGLALLFGCLFAGVALQTWAVLAILWIQCVDDLRDMKQDTAFGQANLAQRFGSGEIVLAAVLLAALMFLWRPWLSLCFIVVAISIEAIFPYVTRRRGAIWHPETKATVQPRITACSTITTADPNTDDRGMMQ